MTEAGRAERDRVDREQWLGRFPGGIPPYPTTTPEEEAHWAKWAEEREAAKAKMEKIEKREAMEAVLDQKMSNGESESEEDMSESV